MRYRIEFGRSIENRLKAQKFRQKVFRDMETGLDEDKFDDLSDHCLIFDRKRDDKLVLVFRSRSFVNMKEILFSYSAQYYDLTKLVDLPFNPLEIGRLCIDPKTKDPFLLLQAFKYLSSLISRNRKDFIFGCTSFVGADNPEHIKSLSSLKKDQLADTKFPIKRKSSSFLDVSKQLGYEKPKPTEISLPPLLKFYLRLGGKVSDHAVVDRELDTLHVFTYVDLKANKLEFESD
jgi:putative hemolysin